MLTTSGVPGKEQRRARRYSVNFLCEIKSAKKPGKIISAHTQDVSCGGLYFSVPEKWKVGTPVEFVLRLPLRATGGTPVTVRCEGKVTRIVEQETGQFGIGATIENYEFVHLDSRESSAAKIKTALIRSAKSMRWPGSLVRLF